MCYDEWQSLKRDQGFAYQMIDINIIAQSTCCQETDSTLNPRFKSSPVIASKAKQSHIIRDCFVTALLAMTPKSLGSKPQTTTRKVSFLNPSRIRVYTAIAATSYMESY